MNMQFHLGICTNVWFLCSTWKYETGKVRNPASMVSALLRKYWPGLYRPEPAAELKLATSWMDFELAGSAGFMSAADAVIKSFG